MVGISYTFVTCALALVRSTSVPFCAKSNKAYCLFQSVSVLPSFICAPQVIVFVLPVLKGMLISSKAIISRFCVSFGFVLIPSVSPSPLNIQIPTGVFSSSHASALLNVPSAYTKSPTWAGRFQISMVLRTVSPLAVPFTV